MSVFRNCSLNASRVWLKSFRLVPQKFRLTRVGAMCDPNKLFIGKLHRWVERDDLLYWMQMRTSNPPLEVYILDPPAHETALKSAFVVYRRAPHNSPGSLH